ncbi:MAG: pseudouridine synthase [Alphaproteobacteria bacterium]|nr:pseudouridine synthase [Alphaproteobacteria bacterium]
MRDKPQTQLQQNKPAASATQRGERIAKLLARAGVASRREAEKMIIAGRVQVNGETIRTPALNILPSHAICVDGQPLAAPEPCRLWRYHKPRGLITTTRDPKARPSIFDNLPPDLPRIMTIGRLDINTEGLLLLTNDGALKRYLELPQTGWIRRYRVRAFGTPNKARLEKIKKGVKIDNITYRPADIELERQQGSNVWLTIALREGKNREIKKLLAYAELQVNRLIRLSFGSFQLGKLPTGAVEEIPRRVLRQQLGTAWADIMAGKTPLPAPKSSAPKPDTRKYNKPKSCPTKRPKKTKHTAKGS